MSLKLQISRFDDLNPRDALNTSFLTDMAGISLMNTSNGHVNPTMHVSFFYMFERSGH